MIYAQWGDLTFELYSYKQHTEDIQVAYAKHQTIKPPSSLQFMGGKELKSIKLSLRFHRDFCNPEQAYKKLIETAEKGEAYKLIIAEKVIGDYVLEKINSSIQQVDSWGNPVIIDIDAEFTEYIKKEIEKKKSKTTKKAPAKTKNKQKADTTVNRQPLIAR